MIDAVLFDFGGVIMTSPFDVFSVLEREAGVPPGTVRAINSRHPDDNAWARIERGEIDADEFVALFEAEATEVGTPLAARPILDVVARDSPADRADAHPAMLEALARLRELGIARALITNNIRPLDRHPGSAWVFDEFDVVVQSCLAHVRKPEPAIYRLALDGLGPRGADPAHAVMLDDLGINLKPARALGMHTIKVTDPAHAAAELLRLAAD